MSQHDEEERDQRAADAAIVAACRAVPQDEDDEALARRSLDALLADEPR